MRKWVLIVLLMTFAQGCDAPWAGPSLPDGSRPLTLALLYAGPIGMGPNIAASTSIADLRAKVLSIPNGVNVADDWRCRSYPVRTDPCWNQQPERPDRLYIAVITNPECTNPTKEASAISGHTVYFIHWAGNPQRICNASMAQPNWRLYSASRGDLPSSGTLIVRLQLQGTEQGGAEAQVELS